MMITPNRRLIAIVIAAGLLLLIPLLARFPWSPGDFIVAGVLLFGTGLACEVVLRMVTAPKYRLAMCAAILFALFIVWAELAVGIIGTPFAGS